MKSIRSCLFVLKYNFCIPKIERRVLTHAANHFSTNPVLLSDDNNNTSESPVKLFSQRRLKKLKLQEMSNDKFKEEKQPLEDWRKESVAEFQDLLKPIDDRVETDTADFPSDHAESNRLQSRLSFRPKVDPSNTSVLLFPGQGSQFVGMGAGLLGYPGVLDMYKLASEIVMFDMLKLCLNGPKSELDKTAHCQLAVFVTALAAVEKLRDTHPKLIENCVATTGFSVGEYAALVFAGAMSFEDAIVVLKTRAQAMQHASEITSSGMMSVICGRESKLGFGMIAAKEYCRKQHGLEQPVCSIANYLCPEIKVIAGHTQALDFLKSRANDLKLRRIKDIPVSGAFHTSLMDMAVGPVAEALSKVTIHKPQIPVHSNVTSARYQDENQIRLLLQKQIVKPVKWEQTMHVIYSRPKGENFPRTVEFGPGKQLGVILKQVNSMAFAEYKNISVASAEQDFKKSAY